MAKPLATVGILSIGDMGLGVAKLLLAHGFDVVTNITGRRYVYSSLLRVVFERSCLESE